MSKTTILTDQEGFDAIRERLSGWVAEMPLEFQWLRLDGEHPDVLVMHRTGGIGKSQIRYCIQHSI